VGSNEDLLLTLHSTSRRRGFLERHEGGTFGTGTTATAVGGTLEPVVGAGALGNVGFVPGETRNLMDTQTLIGSTAAGLGADECQLKTVATNLAEFIAFRKTSTALVGDTHREATLPFQAEKLGLVGAKKDEIVKVEAAVGAAETNKHAVRQVAAEAFVRHDKSMLENV